MLIRRFDTSCVGARRSHKGALAAKYRNPGHACVAANRIRPFGATAAVLRFAAIPACVAALAALMLPGNVLKKALVWTWLAVFLLGRQ
ncbi:hypothetical protein SAMN05192563_1004424 [Paraburkholderia aspalathi]|uniref:Uncharacterized protein n=1 Tax=Paraburkholderia aspalathi TaxID=1324617 RepID=A0A1I7BEZ4_9BURK|nr:hypothetical protein SAMN05192563_1004424 [Paraburkholderia aspalathi]